MKSSFANLEKVSAKLYSEAIEKAERVIAQNKEELEKERQAILTQAREEAKALRAQAQKQIQAEREQMERELKQAGLRWIADLREKTVDAILNQGINKPIETSFQATEFLQKLLLEIAQSFDPKSFRMELSQEWQREWEAQIKAALPHLDIQWNETGAKSFRLVEKEGAFHYEFGEEEFKLLLGNYLKPQTRTLLFGHD